MLMPTMPKMPVMTTPPIMETIPTPPTVLVVMIMSTCRPLIIC